MTKVTTAEELGRAVQSQSDTIEIEGNLATKVIRIRATGKVAWVVAFGAIGLAGASYFLTPTPAAPATVAANLIAAPAAVSILGASAAAAAASIAVGAGSVAALSKLRKYKEVSRSGNVLILKRN